MNIFRKEIRFNIKSLIIWCICTAALVALGMAKFANTAGTSIGASQDMVSLINSFPRSLRALFGIGNFDISTAIGFYGILYIYVLVLGAVHAIFLGAGILTKEETDKTAEFLMIKPITRKKILFCKLLAAVVNIVVLTAITYIASYYSVEMYAVNSDFQYKMLLLMTGFLIVQLVFLSIGFAVAAVCKNPRRAPAISAIILMITYFLYFLVELVGNIDFLKWFTPLEYFRAEDIINKNFICTGFVIIAFSVMIFMFVLAFFKYEKRDLKI